MSVTRAMGLPLSFVLLLGPATAAVAVALHVTRRPKARLDSYRLSVLPRFFLLVCLEDQFYELPKFVGTRDWDNFCEKLVKVLLDIKKTITQAFPESSIDEDLELKENAITLNDELGKCRHVVERIDEELVTLLQKVPTLTSFLDGYLPQPGQTWDSLIDEKIARDEDARMLLESEKPNSSVFQIELIRSCLHTIDKLISAIEELQENNAGTLEIEPWRKAAIQGDLLLSAMTDSAMTDSVLKTSVHYSVVKVFYATDRRVTQDGEYEGEISKRIAPSVAAIDKAVFSTRTGSPVTPGSLLHFGVVEVGIPVKHSTGSMEIPVGAEEADPMNHVVILSVDTKLRGNMEGFLEKVSADLESSDRKVLVFIHGYNVSHKQAVKRAAQLKHDLGFEGVVIAYSWSSRGDLYSYFHDQKNVKKTVPHLEDFLSTMANRLNKARVHILAHSMGNRVLIRALTRLHTAGANECASEKPRYPFSQLIFAAADEKRSRFEDLLALMDTTFMSEPSGTLPQGVVANGDNRLATINGLPASSESSSFPTPIISRPHLTVYSSTKDSALHFSMAAHKFKHRLGDTRSFFESDFPSKDHLNDVVDATGIDNPLTDPLGHSYYGSVSKVIEDIRILLHEETPAKDRNLIRKMKKGGKVYYSFPGS